MSANRVSPEPAKFAIRIRESPMFSRPNNMGAAYAAGPEE
jgi:hypothetical protein